MKKNIKIGAQLLINNPNVVWQVLAINGNNASLAAMGMAHAGKRMLIDIDELCEMITYVYTNKVNLKLY